VGGTEVVKREPEDLTRKSISPSERLLVGRPSATSSAHNNARLDPHTKEILEAQIIKEESLERSNLSQKTFTTSAVEDKMSTAEYLGFAQSPGQTYGTPYLATSPGVYTTNSSTVVRGPTPGYTAAAEPQYYTSEPYYTSRAAETQYSLLTRPEYPSTNDNGFDRYNRTGTIYKGVPLTVDSSPDSGTSSDPGREHLFQPQVRNIFSMHALLFVRFYVYRTLTLFRE